MVLQNTYHRWEVTYYMYIKCNRYMWEAEITFYIFTSCELVVFIIIWFPFDYFEDVIGGWE